MILSFFVSQAFSQPYLEGEITGYQTLPFSLDNEATQSQQESWLRTRFFIGQNLAPAKNWRIKTRLEFSNAQIWGDYSTLGTSVDDNIFRIQRSDNSDIFYALPRDLSISYTSEKWGFNIGVQSFLWGLGILSHDGRNTSRFGTTQQGNTYARAGLFTVPSANNRGMMFFGAADIIIRDENAFLYEGDSAAQFITGVQQLQPDLKWGFISGLRYQIDREDELHPLSPTTSFAIPFDGYVQWDLKSGLQLAAESVYVYGITNRIYSEQTRGENSSIGYMGGVARIQHNSAMLQGTFNPLLEIGYASGDANSTDQKARTLSFHSDYNVGLLLYDEILPKVQARSMERLVDPDLSQTPPSGLRYGVSQGGVSNSFYTQLCTTWSTETLLIRAGWLHAYSAVPLSDAYQSGISGGYLKDHLGENAEQYALGNELDIRLQYSPIQNIRLILDAGTFFPGSALSFMEPSWMLMAQANVLVGGAQ